MVVEKYSPKVIQDSELLIVLDKTEQQKSVLSSIGNSKKTTLSVNVFLIEYKNYKILIDTGIGNSISSPTFKNYEIIFKNHLPNKLKSLNLSFNDITHVILSHLHFDHVGGAVDYDKKRLSCPNANYYVQKLEMDFAEKKMIENKSYLKKTISILKNSEQLILIDQKNYQVTPEVEMKLVGGHTPGFSLVVFTYNKKEYIFPGDLLPTPWQLRYENIEAIDFDRSKLKEEKEKFIDYCIKNKSILFWQHIKDQNGFTLFKNKQNNISYKKIRNE